jgi:hypothetical protein
MPASSSPHAVACFRANRLDGPKTAGRRRGILTSPQTIVPRPRRAGRIGRRSARDITGHTAGTCFQSTTRVCGAVTKDVHCADVEALQSNRHAVAVGPGHACPSATTPDSSADTPSPAIGPRGRASPSGTAHPECLVGLQAAAGPTESKGEYDHAGRASSVIASPRNWRCAPAPLSSRPRYLRWLAETP